MTRRRRAAPRRWAWLAVVLALVVAGGLLDRFAPAQDLPWKPFSLNRPIGWATHVQLARIGYDQAACQAALAAGDVDFTPAPPLVEGDCHVLNGGRLGEGLAPLKPPGPLMSCQEALAFVAWERHAVQPAAYAAFGKGVVQIEHFGTYACRPMRGHRSGFSEHAFANAIDVSGFRLSDGRLISVLFDYRDPGPRGVFLHDIHDGPARCSAIRWGQISTPTTRTTSTWTWACGGRAGERGLTLLQAGDRVRLNHIIR